MQTRILTMIEMLTQNPDVAKHRLVQSMPFSIVDPRSTKPNKHFPLIFGRFWTSMCNLVAIESRNSAIVRVFTTDTICTDWILVPLVTITTMCNAEYQSKYNLQLLYKFHGRRDYWKCVYVTFDLFIVFFCTFLGKYMIPRFCFLKKAFQKGLSIILSIPFL